MAMSKLLKALKQIDANPPPARQIPHTNRPSRPQEPVATAVESEAEDRAAVTVIPSAADVEAADASEAEHVDPLARIRELNRLLEEALASRRSAGAQQTDADAGDPSPSESTAPSAVAGEPAAESTPQIPIAAEFADLADRLLEETGTTSPAVVTFVAASPEAAGSQWLEPFAVALLQKLPGRLLLVEADTDHSQWPARFGIEATTGLVEVLQSRATWRDCLRPTAIPRLDILARGQGTIPNLGSSTAPLIALLENVKSEYALIMLAAGAIDRPAAATLAARSDGAVLVIVVKSTPRSAAEQAKRLLIASGAKILGAIARG
jgi:Mrp family chromosome partitioning ATPase